ncbi:hypothetical protein K501DRAFT_223781 [Backusella circina FSU 941]|nr:hypothetical protein K501DRAFT_223781 [Backusella circina FSU 941]
MDGVRSVVPFKGKLNSTGSLILLLKTIQFKNMTTCHIYEAGITFTVEESRSMKAVIFLKKPMFEYFIRQDIDIPQFSIGLPNLIDCLHLISPLAQTGSVPLDSSCEIRYEEGQLELANPDRERGRLVRAKLNTLESEDEDLGLNLTQEGQSQKMVMKSEWFITALNDLDDTCQTITFTFSPMDPSFKMSAVGEDNIVEMDYPENSEPFISFVCDREVTNSYSYSNIMLCKKALDHSSEVSFEVSPNGVLCLLFQIEEKNELLHVSFTIMPSETITI